MIKLQPFSSEYSEQFVNLWNQIFCNKPKFTPLTLEKLNYIITKPNYIKFEDTCLLLIYINDDLIGFFHYLLAPKILREEFFDMFSKDLHILLICNFGIKPEARNKGIATQTLKHILRGISEESVKPPGIHSYGATTYLDIIQNINRETTVAIFDTRNISNFWGNALYPDEILWGHPEGIGINENDLSTRNFVKKFSIHPLKEAIELKLTLNDFITNKTEKNVISFENLEPVLNKNVDELKHFKTDYHSKTFITRYSNNKVSGYIIVFPLKANSTDDWGIYELNVLEKGIGLGSALLQESIKFLKSKGCKNLYTVTIPDESPDAVNFYKKYNFIEIERWLV